MKESHPTAAECIETLKVCNERAERLCRMYDSFAHVEAGPGLQKRHDAWSALEHETVTRLGMLMVRVNI